MSEVPQTGRMSIHILTLAVFVLLQIPTALATNYGILMAFRFLTGFFGPPVLATGGTAIADLYSPTKRAYGMTIWGVFATSAPGLGPLLGSFSARFEGTGNTSIMSASEIVAAAMSRRSLAVDVLVRPFALNFQEQVVFAPNVYVGLIYTLLYVWFESFLFVFLGIYHWREQLFGPSSSASSLAHSSSCTPSSRISITSRS